MVISAQTWGQEWATPQMKETLSELRSLGVNAVTIHPYAWIRNDGSLKIDVNPDPDYVKLPMQWAGELGMRRMLTPHIGYWGSKFLWRGEIVFEDAAEHERFFADYRQWMLGQAVLAERYDVEIFVVGLEYGLLQKHDLWWRQLIADVRKVYQGKVTYAANWNEIENVPFWDALDYIGVIAYFPLTTAKNPTVQQLEAGWRPWREALGELSRRHGKQTLFVEIGYNESAVTAAEPWAFATGGENAIEIRKRCIEVALKLESTMPELAGMFFWKWFPNMPNEDPENFDMRSPPVKELLKRVWNP